MKHDKDLDAEISRLGKFPILSNMDVPPREVYEPCKSRVEETFDMMEIELENDKAYLHTTDYLMGYYFISFISLNMYFSVL